MSLEDLLSNPEAADQQAPPPPPQNTLLESMTAPPPSNAPNTTPDAPTSAEMTSRLSDADGDNDASSPDQDADDGGAPDNAMWGETESGPGLRGQSGKISQPKVASYAGAGLNVPAPTQGITAGDGVHWATDPDYPHHAPTDSPHIAEETAPMGVSWANIADSNVGMSPRTAAHSGQSTDIHAGSTSTRAKLEQLLSEPDDVGFARGLLELKYPALRQDRMQSKMTKVMGLRNLYVDQFNAESRNALESQPATQPDNLGSYTDKDGNLMQILPGGKSRHVTETVTHNKGPDGAQVGPMPDVTEDVPANLGTKPLPQPKQVGIHPIPDSASGWVQTEEGKPPVYNKNTGYAGPANSRKDAPADGKPMTATQAEAAINAQVKIEQQAYDKQTAGMTGAAKRNRPAFDVGKAREKAKANLPQASKGGGTAIKIDLGKVGGMLKSAPPGHGVKGPDGNTYVMGPDGKPTIQPGS